MLVKILIIAAFIMLVLYVVLPKRRASTPAPARAGRLALTLLASAGVVLFILSLFCALLWLGGMTNAVGGGDVLGGTGLLRIAAVLLVMALVCGVVVLFKRR